MLWNRIKRNWLKQRAAIDQALACDEQASLGAVPVLNLTVGRSEPFCQAPQQRRDEHNYGEGHRVCDEPSRYPRMNEIISSRRSGARNCRCEARGKQRLSHPDDRQSITPCQRSAHRCYH